MTTRYDNTLYGRDDRTRVARTNYVGRHPKRKVFFSFHYEEDAWRTQQVRNIGAIEGNRLVSPNKWEDIKRQGDDAIERWIDEQLEQHSCLAVLIGKDTYKRRWVRYEAKRAWEMGKGVLGIRIHALKNQHGQQSHPGRNPLDYITVNGRELGEMADTYDPRTYDSKAAYKYIEDGIEAWVEKAVADRS